MKENPFETILDCVSLSLFKTNKKNIDTTDIPQILTEASRQTVFPLVYSALCGEYDLSQYQTQYFRIISNNVKVVEEHKKLHKLLSENGIPYVILKGCASARYYPDPLLRTMGDVDFLVNDNDIEKTVNLLLENGYKIDGEEAKKHISLRNSTNNVHIELHRIINGIPSNATGEKISALFADIFEKAVLENGQYYRPSAFHHGLILLLHTASHLTNEGIGLRHLCDWAVFCDSFDDEEFVKTFEEPLKSVGLWKFAEVLTQFAVKYLGCPLKNWCAEPQEEILLALANDILSAGNFGKKDFSRYQQIKYISDRTESKVSSTNPLKRLLLNMTSKAREEIGFVKKSPWLLPIGFILVILKYLWLVITGKRKMDNKTLIKGAFDRKELYDNFELFK